MSEAVAISVREGDTRTNTNQAYSEESSTDRNIDRAGLSDNQTTVNIQPPSAYTCNISSGLSGINNSFSPNTSKNSSVIFCRICHEGESAGERLISPCRCSGSMGLVHRTCIEKWLTIVNVDTCELCREKYSVTRHPRPFSTWLCEPVVGDDQRNLVGDGCCFLLLTPLAAISAYLCASGAVFYFEEKKSEAIGLICLSSLLVTIYLAWLVLTIRYHCQVWFKWRINNQDIRLLNVSGPGHRVVAVPKQRKSSIVNVFEDEGNVRPETFVENQRCVSSSDSLLNGGDSSVEAIGLEHNVNSNNHEEKSFKASEDLPTPTLPLSPCIISSDPQEHSHSKVIRSTDDSEIYAQIPIPCSSEVSRINTMQFPLDHQLSIRDRAVSVPYIPDLKEHFIALKTKQDVNSKVKSRGTFSPNRRHRTVTFTVTEVKEAGVPQPQNKPIESSEKIPCVKAPPPPVPVRYHQ